MVYNLANIVNATELYTETQLKWQLLCYVYFTKIKKMLYKKKSISEETM